MAQQELADAVAGRHQVAANVLAGADQIAHRLFGRRRHPDSVQAADHQQPHQPLGVAAVGIDPILGGALDLARGGHRALNAPRRKCPRQPEAGRAGLIGDPHWCRQSGAELRHLLGHSTHSLHRQLARLRVGDRRDDLRRVNIETHPRPTCAMSTPHDCGPRRGHSSATNPRISCAGADLYAGFGSNRRSGGPAIGSSWSVIADGPGAGRTVALSREADLATRRLPWRPPLHTLTDNGKPTGDDALALRADKATQWLRRRFQSPKFERDLTALESGIEDPKAKRFEVALQTLGQLLGFDAERPAKEEAAPDGAWQDGSRAWILWEAKTAEEPEGKISAEETRQANSHADWVRHNYSWTEPESAVTVMVTPKQALHQSVSGVASPHLYMVSPATITEISRATVEIHRQLAGQLIGLRDDEAADQMATALKARNLDTSSLIDRLSTSLSADKAPDPAVVAPPSLQVRGSN